VRRDLTRYIRSRRLRDPIRRHSMAAHRVLDRVYHPELVGPVSWSTPAGAVGDLDEAKAPARALKHASETSSPTAWRAAVHRETSGPGRWRR